MTRCISSRVHVACRANTCYLIHQRDMRHRLPCMLAGFYLCSSTERGFDMQWILWVIAVTANGNDLVIDKTIFDSQETCIAALSQIQGINNTAIGSNARLESMCLQSGL